MASSAASETVNSPIARPANGKNCAIQSLDISILVPVMNEAGNIRPLIDEICATFSNRRFEIIYVDDASDDATAEELVAALADIPQLRVLRHFKRAGQSAAIRSGLLQAKGTLIGVLDGDGQNVPADFPALEAVIIDASKDGALVMAAGIRQSRNDSAVRLLASSVAKWVRVSLLADTHPDSGCGIKILPRALFMQLPFFNHMHRFMPSLVRRHGGVVLGVPVAHRPRIVGVSKYRILDRLLVGVSDVLGVIWLLRRAPEQAGVSEVVKSKSTTGSARGNRKKVSSKSALKAARGKAQ
ncbi:glycosyltransferase family 2 protein [Candidatus Puniceispirillum sp.]|nr:glycosyltransferase family 2 protein [Candidatus Puniceispirillum sp.]